MRGALAVAAVVATVWIFREPIVREPFMGDEAVWIPSGNYYLGLILKGDFRNADWVANHLETGGNFNPHLGKVLLALGIRWHPNRMAGDTDYATVYDWSKPPEWNRANGHMPSEGLLVRGRESAGVFVAGCAVLLLIAGTLVSGEIAGVLAVALVLASVTIQSLLALAVTDGHYNFFILCGFVSSLGLIRSQRTASFVGYSALMGVSAGLACSVKITGLPVVAFYYCLLLPTLWRAQGLTLRTGLYGPLTAIAAALIVVYTLNPFFWPFESPQMMLEFPRLYVRTREAFAAMPNNTWGTPPDRWGGIHTYLFDSAFWAVPGEVFAFAGGVIVCGWSLVRGLMQRRVDPLGALLIYFVAHYVFIVSLIQFNWARYYLPVVFSMKLLTAVGIAVPLHWAWTWLRPRISTSPANSDEGLIAVEDIVT